MECQFCNNIFGNTKMLRQHQKKTKYCLKIQEIKAKEEHVSLIKFLEVKEIEENKRKDIKEAEELSLKEKNKELTCQFCGKQCTTKYILSSHQKQAKYCLKIQESQNHQDIISCLVTCKFCGKNFSNTSFSRHDAICKKKLESLTAEINILKAAEKDQEIAMMKKDQEMMKKEIEKAEEISSIYKAVAVSVQATIDEIAIIKAWQTIVEIEEEIDTPEELKDEPYELVPLELDNGYIIESREEDGYIDVTNLCTAGKKKFKHWNSLSKTTGFLKELSSTVGIPTVELIKQNTGGNGNRHTWVHPQVAINIAQWISPRFDVKVSAWVLEVMMTGKVDITNTKSYRELQEDNKNKQLKIQIMTKKYVKKQPRVQYDKENVVYILTTANMKKERRYILGKATNLTSRLSVYNKSDEHEVVYYQECPDQEKMSVVETLVFCKLNEYREQANRERFLLPEGTSIDLFSDTIRECIKFIK
jgi:hypothetical protein